MLLEVALLCRLDVEERLLVVGRRAVAAADCRFEAIK
jgi:hypothetical protein